jgi:hypothetical protein
MDSGARVRNTHFPSKIPPSNKQQIAPLLVSANHLAFGVGDRVPKLVLYADTGFDRLVKLFVRKLEFRPIKRAAVVMEGEL